MVNRGYQSDDKSAFDYELWKLPGSDLDVRGPAVDVRTQPFFTAIGAAQTFGRFAQVPYCELVAQASGMAAINLGFSGAGPSFFTRNGALLDYINRSQFVIIQMMSGRSISNSRFRVARNQGLVTVADSESDATPVFAEHAYQKLLTSVSEAEAVRLRAEIRTLYVREMQTLFDAISVPKMLLYWSTRLPDYKEGVGSIGPYWGAFPHFVNSSVLDLLKPDVDSYVEIVTNKGLPQPVFDLSGQPVLLWPEEKFPGIQLRHHNLYYPSPEMHVDAADAIVAAGLPVRGRRRAKKAVRNVLIHMHIFKNAGSSIDVSLKQYFGAQWRNIDPTTSGACFGNGEVIDELERNTSLMALSSHQLRFPLVGSSYIRLHPFLLLRHPVDRVRSIYDWERLELRQTQSAGLHTKKAGELSFPDFVDWCLSMPRTRAPISNYQTRLCSSTLNGVKDEDWAANVSLANLLEAEENLSELQVVGVVEEFELTVDLLSRNFGFRYPGLKFKPVQTNATQLASEGMTLTQRLEDIKRQIGEQAYNKLLIWNEFDLELHSFGRRRMGLSPFVAQR